MKLICVWCKKVIRDGPENPVSHGICRECARCVPRRDPRPAVYPSFIARRIWGDFILWVILVLLWLTVSFISDEIQSLFGLK